MIDDLYRDRRKGHILFWLDTLCIPRSPELLDFRKQAIRQMSKVFEFSDKVLVLDKSLQGFDTHNGLEPIIRINMSNWSRRLWTLQEGFLYKDLCFRFKDGRLLHITDAKKRFDAANQNLHLSWIGAAQVFSPAVRSLQERSPDNAVAHLWQAVQWRTSQKVEDETVCLAALLGMDPEQLLNPSENLDQKMCHFISMLDENIGIPSGMIFLPGPKLDVKGFGWAPKTWMAGTQNEHPYPLFLACQPTFLTTRGLLVRHPGILLRMTDVPEGAKFWVSTSENLTQWYLVEYAEDELRHTADVNRRDWFERLGSCESFAIILSRRDPQKRPEIALLVSIVKERESVKWVHSLCRVWISLESRPDAIGALKQRFKQDGNDVTRGENVSADQYWCVDGANVCPHTPRDI
jgi:hypothetical protein